MYEETVIVTLTCDEEALFNVFFEPKATGTSTFLIKLHVVENPYVFYDITPQGFAFTENITFEGLTYIPQVTHSMTKLLKDAAYYYELTFNDCITKILYFIQFKVYNNTDKTYRVLFPVHKHFQFVPNIVHILPKNQKNCFALLVAPSQINITNVSYLFLFFQIVKK